MPENLQNAMRSLWGASWSSSAIDFYSVRNVFVVGEGLVFDTNLNLIDLSITQNSPDVIEQAVETLRTAIETRSFATHSGTSLLCGKAGLNNYGHWLAEMLPRVHLASEWIKRPDGWKVLVPKAYDIMRPVIEESLDLADIPTDRRIIGDGQPMLVDELVIVDGLTRHGQFFSPLVVSALDEITATVPQGSDPLIWVTRHGDLRSLVHEEEVNQRLTDLGWKVIVPGTMTLREQIAAARGARQLAGVNGAGLANLLFMRPGGCVTSFIPDVMPDIFYWQLCGHRGLTYAEVRSGLLDGSHGSTPWNARLTLPVLEVLETLAQASQHVA